MVIDFSRLPIELSRLISLYHLFIICCRPHFVVYGVTEHDHTRFSYFSYSSVQKNQQHQRIALIHTSTITLIDKTHTPNSFLVANLLKWVYNYTELDSVLWTELLISKNELQTLLPYLIGRMAIPALCKYCQSHASEYSDLPFDLLNTRMVKSYEGITFLNRTNQKTLQLNNLSNIDGGKGAETAKKAAIGSQFDVILDRPRN